MHKMRHEYACDWCGFVEESAYSLPKWLRWGLGPDPVRNAADVQHFDFCSEDCRDKWLKDHNFEVKE